MNPSRIIPTKSTFTGPGPWTFRDTVALLAYFALAIAFAVTVLLASVAFAQDDPRVIAPTVVAATPTPAPEVTPIPEGADPTVVIPLALRLVDAVEQGQYAIAAGLALMILTFLALRIPGIRGRVPKDYAATFLLGTALFGSFGASLASGADPGRAALAGLVCSSLAIAFWEAAGKHLVKLWAKLTSPAVGGGA